MFPTRNGYRRNVDIRAGAQGHCAPRHASHERRSASRPFFMVGWRKPVGPRFAAVSQNASPGSNHRVDVWVGSTDGLLRAKSCLQLLTGKDWAALTRIQHPASRNSSIASRILLRLGLSMAVDRTVAPADWDFSVTAQQRPVVADGLPQIHFSVSHVDQLAAVAISPHLNIGIDVESIDQDVTEDVMAAFCHRDERRSVRDLSGPQRVREFIRLWTLKEAYTKLVGVGHALDFQMIKFMLDPVDLASAGGGAAGVPTQFENFYVSLNHALFHASLAVEEPRIAGSTEVRIISLADPAGGGAAQVSPSYVFPSCISP